MYRDLRPNRTPRRIDFIIEVKNYTVSCGGCPTIIDFVDNDGTKYYFRLRHGHARIVCEDNDEILVSESMKGFDGVCSFDDAIKWARFYGVALVY